MARRVFVLRCQGRILFLLDRDPRADLIAAHHLSPYRAEPLVELSNWHANRAATRCFLLPKRPVTAAATAAVTGDTTDAVSLTGDVAKEVPTTGGGASGATGEEEDEEEAPVDSLCVLKHRAASWSYAKRALALPLPTRVGRLAQASCAHLTFALLDAAPGFSSQKILHVRCSGEPHLL